MVAKRSRASLFVSAFMAEIRKQYSKTCSVADCSCVATVQFPDGTMLCDEHLQARVDQVKLDAQTAHPRQEIEVGVWKAEKTFNLPKVDIWYTVDGGERVYLHTRGKIHRAAVSWSYNGG